MALVLAGLQENLRALQVRPPSSREIAAERWSTAYVSYAVSAQALDAKCVVLPTASIVLQNAFLKSMTNASFLADLLTNINLFWTAPPVAFTGLVHSGVAIGVSPAASVAWSLGLNAYIASNLNNRSSQLNPLGQLASLIHSLTVGVACTLTNLQSGVTTTAFLT